MTLQGLGHTPLFITFTVVCVMYTITPLFRSMCSSGSTYAPLDGGCLPQTGVYCGAGRAPYIVSTCCPCHMCLLYVNGVLGMYLMQERSDPCKFPSPMELWDIYAFYETGMYKPMMKLMENRELFIIRFGM